MPRLLFDLATYLLDASVLIEIHKKNDPKEADAFWDWLAIAHKDGNVFSIDKVQQELQDPGLIKMFRKKMYKEFFKKSSDVSSTYKELTKLIENNPRWTKTAKNYFLRAESADSFLISHAKEHDLALVTLEKPGNKESAIKIPNVCDLFGVQCINTVQMLENEQHNQERKLD